MPIRAVIFDCDGVLFDSSRANIGFYNAVLARAGVPPLDADGRRIATALAGPQVLEAISGGDATLARRLRDAAREVDYAPFFEHMIPAPRLFDVLAELKADHRLAMATNRGSTTPRVVERFGLGRYLDLAVGVLDVPRPKPFPDMIEKCLDAFALAAAEAVYVGDSPTDLEAAAAAGVPFVGVGEHTGSEVRIDALRELPELIARAGSATGLRPLSQPGR